MRVRITSDFAVGGELCQRVDDVCERWPLLEAERPAARHQLVDFGGASVGDRELQFARLQT